MGNVSQYDGISRLFAGIAENDPLKVYLQYHTLARLCGDVKGKLILDVGCGEGTFSRALAKSGAEVVGYDISSEQIKNALLKEKASPLGIRYFVSDAYSFSCKERFDLAISNMVLQYSGNKDDLKQFFISAFSHLKEKGEFISITMNPDFKVFGKIICNRKWTKNPDGSLTVHFYKDNSELITTAKFGPRFSKKDYESSAKSAGFKEVRWRKVMIGKDGLIRCGKAFWTGIKKDCPYMVFVARR